MRLFAALALVLLAGCSGRGLTERRTPQQDMLVAVSDPNPDQRRVAVARVAGSSRRSEDWAVRGLVVMALLEEDSQARGVAIRGLVDTCAPRAAETLVKVLSWRSWPADEVRPPDDVARWDAAEGLARLSARGAISDQLRPKVAAVFVDRLSLDSERHVRLAAARGLGWYEGSDVLRALIAALRDADFAVVYEAEGSLARITGRTHDCDAEAWEAWLAEVEPDSLARADRLPGSRRPHYTNGFEKAGYHTREIVRWLFPGRKPK